MFQRIRSFDLDLVRSHTCFSERQVEFKHCAVQVCRHAQWHKARGWIRPSLQLTTNVRSLSVSMLALTLQNEAGCAVCPKSPRIGPFRHLDAERVHCRFVDRAMEFTGPAMMLIVFICAKGLDNESSVSRPLERTEKRGLRTDQLRAKSEVSLKPQALDEKLHGGRRILADTPRHVCNDQMKVVPYLGEGRPCKLGHKLCNDDGSAKAPPGKAGHTEIAGSLPFQQPWAPRPVDRRPAGSNGRQE